jgi:hypothetical protein
MEGLDLWPRGAENTGHTSSVNGELKTLGDAFEHTVVERQDEVLVLGEPFRLMAWVHCIHALKCTNPRRPGNLECCVWLKASLRQWVTSKSFIIRWAEHVGNCAREANKGAGLSLRVFADNSDSRTIPPLFGFFQVVRDMKEVLARQDGGAWSTDRRLREILSLGDAVVFVD